MRYFAVIVDEVIGCLVVEESDNMLVSDVVEFLAGIEPDATIEERDQPFDQMLTVSEMADGIWFDGKASEDAA